MLPQSFHKSRGERFIIVHDEYVPCFLSPAIHDFRLLHPVPTRGDCRERTLDMKLCISLMPCIYFNFLAMRAQQP